MYSGYHWNISEWTVCLSKAVWYFSPCDGRKICFQYRVVVNSVGVDYGTQTVGALGVSNSISALSTVPAGSIGDGGASIIRQNIGSGKKDRAPEGVQKRISGGRGLGNIGIFTTWIFLNPILSVFSGGDAVFAQLIRQIFCWRCFPIFFLQYMRRLWRFCMPSDIPSCPLALILQGYSFSVFPFCLPSSSFTALSGGTAMGIVMMVSNGLTGLFAPAGGDGCTPREVWVRLDKTFTALNHHLRGLRGDVEMTYTLKWRS